MPDIDDEDALNLIVEEADEFVVISDAADNPIPSTQGDYLAVSTENIPYIPVPGAPGDEGDSAYEVWLAEGNVGTEQDFLDSLKGEQGEQGPPGPSGSAAAAYTHDQAVPADVWTVTHNLGFHPSVTTFDSAGSEQIGSIQHIDVNSLTVSYTVPLGGKAYCS